KKGLKYVYNVECPAKNKNVVSCANRIFRFFNVASCFPIGIGGFGSTFSIKNITPTIESIVNSEMSIKGDRQPNVFPSINPIGSPRAIEPLIPIETRPIARPRYLGSTILGAKIRHKITNRDPLAADTTLPINTTAYVVLKIVMIFPIRKIKRDINVSCFRSILDRKSVV